MLNKNGIILVEADRRDQVEIIKSFVKRKFVHYRKRPFSLRKSPGYTSFIFEPSLSEYLNAKFMHCWYLLKSKTQMTINQIIK